MANLIRYISTIKILKFTNEIKVISFAFSISKVCGDETCGARPQLICTLTP
jgi:hypothetical protein